MCKIKKKLFILCIYNMINISVENYSNAKLYTAKVYTITIVNKELL